MHVQPFVRNAGPRMTAMRDHGEGLVDLPEIDVADAQPIRRKQLLDGGDRRTSETAPAPARGWRGRGAAPGSAVPRRRRASSRISTSAAAPSEIDEELAARHRAVLAEGGLELRDLVGSAVRGARPWTPRRPRRAVP